MHPQNISPTRLLSKTDRSLLAGPSVSLGPQAVALQGLLQTKGE